MSCNRHSSVNASAGQAARSDFDWAVNLSDVWLGGRSEWICDGFLRASLRRVDEARSRRNAAGEIIRPWYPFDAKQPVPPGEVGRRGLDRLRLGARRGVVLRRAGRPVQRRGRVCHYCVDGERRARVLAVFGRGGRGRLRLVASTARSHRARGVATGARAGRVRGRRVGPGLRVRGRFVYPTRRGRVRDIAVVGRRLVRRPRSLRANLRLAGLR
jgi:hypothetical protein